jgi:hypothetical protein
VPALNLDEDGILTAAAHLEGNSETHTLTIERTTHLLRGSRIHFYISEAEQIRPQDTREAEEGLWLSQIKSYEKNEKMLVDAEGQNAEFKAMMPLRKVACLMAYIRNHTPSPGQASAETMSIPTRD